MKIFGFTFGKQLEVALPALDYNDALEAALRATARLEADIELFRGQRVELETCVAGLEADARELVKSHNRDLEDAQDSVEAEIRAAKRAAAADLITLTEEKEDLQLQIDRLNSARKIADQEVEHMVRLADEASKLEVREATLEIQEKANTKIQTVKDNYQTKLEEIREEQVGAGDERFEQLLAALPQYKGKVKSNTGE